jgi:endonuclease/exonuclease/phosphatase family metal-dependent hydrolase
MQCAHFGRHAILSRFPIVSHQSHLTPMHGGGTGVRMIEARIALPGSPPLAIYAVHLWWSSEITRLGQIGHGLAQIARREPHPHILLGDFNALAPGDAFLPHLYVDDPESEPPFPTQDERLAEELPDLYTYEPERAVTDKSLPYPKHDVVARVESAGYVDAFRAAGHGELGTWLVPDAQIRVDYIFVPSTLQRYLARTWRLDTGLARVASDHYPVLADVRLDRDSRGL